MKNHLTVLLIAVLSFFSCSHYFTEGDYFFISRAGAEMPAWVRGNTDSGVFIIVNHGGPGGTASYLCNFYAMKELEKKYALVYWDQRCSGISQGNAAATTFTADDFVLDLDLLTDAVIANYEPSALFIYGISWGGTLGTAYLTDPVRQNKISGFIEEGGGHNMPLLMELSSELVLAYAEGRIAAGADRDYWSGAVSLLSEKPDPALWSAEDYYAYADYLLNAHPFEFTPSPYPGEYSGPDSGDIFLSPLSFAMFLNPGMLVKNFNILTLDLNPIMPAITLPVLLLWGAYDKNSPVQMAENAADRLGTAPADLRLRIIPDSGHNTAIDQPDLFLAEFTGFVEAFR